MLSEGDSVSILNETPIIELGFRRVAKQPVRVHPLPTGMSGFRLSVGDVTVDVPVHRLHRGDRALAQELVRHSMHMLEYAAGGGEVKW
jgi:hypothetical protein